MFIYNFGGKEWHINLVKENFIHLFVKYTKVATMREAELKDSLELEILISIYTHIEIVNLSRLFKNSCQSSMPTFKYVNIFK